jgi:hypothetical protein
LDATTFINALEFAIRRSSGNSPNKRGATWWIA